MAYKIIWAEISIEDYEKIIYSLQESWTENVAKEFATIVRKKVESISIFPNRGVESETTKNVRSIHLTKHNRLFYIVFEEENIVQILSIFDTRQNPNKNQY